MTKHRLSITKFHKTFQSAFFLLILLGSPGVAYTGELDELKNCIAEFKSKSTGTTTPIEKPTVEHGIKSGERLISDLSNARYSPSSEIGRDYRKRRIDGIKNNLQQLAHHRKDYISDRWDTSFLDAEINYKSCLVSTLGDALASTSTSTAEGLERTAGNCVESRAGWHGEFFIIKGLNNCGVTQRLWACIEDPGHADSCRTGRFPATSYTILGSKKGSSENIPLRAGRDINVASKGKELRYKWWACEDPYKPARTATGFECVDFFAK